jgi:D-glycero-D-manno-heptose 1,7-bisphosphate phosphatase
MVRPTTDWWDCHNMKRPAIFLDRDGVINQDRSDYVKSWAEFEFLPGVLEALRCLAASPYTVVIVTNQSGIGRGLVAKESIEAIHFRMLQIIRRAGGRVDAIYYCPHHPNDSCACRKPRPGLLIQAANDLNLDLARSWFVGNNQTDLEAALAAGVEPVLVRSGNGSGLPQLAANCVLVFDNLPHAVDAHIRQFWELPRSTEIR